MLALVTFVTIFHWMTKRKDVPGDNTTLAIWLLLLAGLAALAGVRAP